MIQENTLVPIGRMNVALVIMLQATLSAQSIMIGIIPGESHTHVSHSIWLIFLFSIRTKLWDAALGYDISSSLFLRCLYKGEDGDPEYPLEGFLKGPLLVCISCLIYNIFDSIVDFTVSGIPTSPSSTTKNEISESTSRWRNIANVLRMNQHITPWSIAYAVTQVHWHLLMLFSSFLIPPKLIFSLGTAQEWKHKHNGFNYPSFYDFIVDFFEDIEDNTAQKNADDVLA